MNRIPAARSREEALNIAHRGARAFALENTIDAIVKAKRAGADMVEIDVQSSSGNIPIVFHDADLSARTDVRARFPDRAPWCVHQFTASELTSLDAGSWFASQFDYEEQIRESYLREMTADERREFLSTTDLDRYRSGLIHLPKLRETLECAEALPLLVNIESKSLPRRDPELVRAVIDVIQECEMSSHVIVSSFDHERLLEVRARDGNIATAVLTRDRLAYPVNYVRDVCGAVALHLGCTDDSDSLTRDASGAVDSDLIRGVRNEGLLVNAWTENNPARMRALIDAGVSGSSPITRTVSPM